MTEEQKEKRRARNREYMRAYEERKRQDPDWLEKKREYFRQYAKKWAAEHPEIISAKNKAQYEKKKSDPERWEKEKARNRSKYHRYKDSPSQRRWNRSNVCGAKGITIEQYDEMLQEQNRVCAICQSPDPDKRRKHFAIDHCHSTGKVRGLLCTRCNQMIGFAKDDTKILASAIRYLESR